MLTRTSSGPGTGRGICLYSSSGSVSDNSVVIRGWRNEDVEGGRTGAVLIQNLCPLGLWEIWDVFWATHDCEECLCCRES